MKQMKINRLLLLLFCITAGQLYSQGTQVSGTILDDLGQPLPGANILEVGTTNGVQSDFDGNFSISVANSNAVLSVSFIGFKTVDYPLNGQTRLTITMEASADALDEVIVVGYGSQKKSDVTGAITSVSGEDINITRESNPLNALAGKVAGVDIGISNNAPGSNPSILVRGRSSLTFSNEPLIVVDGIPLEGSLGDVNPADISSIEVLKDASSAAIYGARGANGVILVTTKRGVSGKPRFNFDTYTGFAVPFTEFNMMNSEQWVAMRRESQRAAADQDNGLPVGTSPIPSVEDALEPLQLQAFRDGVDTNFQDLATQTGEQSNYNIGVNGGSDKVRYAVSLNYFKQEGVFKLAEFERYTFRANLDMDLTKNLKVGISQQAGFGERQDSNPIGGVLSNSPLTRPFNADGSPTTDPLADGLVWNPLNDLDRKNFIDKTKNFRYFANIFASYNLFNNERIGNLKYTLSLQPQFETIRRNNFRGTQSGVGRGVRNEASKTERINTSYTLENILNYNIAFNENHALDATFLYSFQDSERDFFTLGVSGLPSDTQTFNNLSDGELVDFRDSSLDTEEWTSYMARVNYTLFNKYLFTLTGRYDGSSKLSQGNKWGFFPSAAFAWKVLEENFMQQQTVFSDLKLRLGYGEVGRNPIAPFATLGGLGRTEGSFGGQAAFGFLPQDIANPDLKWETTKTFNVGIDYAILNNRISGSIDYYSNETEDLLLNRFLPATSGFQSILQNVGKTSGEGLDVVLSAVLIDSENFKWSADFNYSVNTNKIDELANGKVDDVGNRWFIGKQLNVLYDRVFDGIWQLDEVAEAASFGRRPGDIKLKDLDNNGVINDDDRRIIGQLDPKWTGGVTSRMQYKGFDLSFALYTRQGHVTRARVLETSNTLFGRFNNLNVDFWTPENPSNTFPRPNANQERPLDSQVLSFIDASFVRVRNITLGYNFAHSSKITEILGLDQFRIYATAQNPFLFTSTDLDGLDPEVAAGTPNIQAGSAALDPNTFMPSPRTFLFGINVSF
ncbi:TonB-dependent receptor [Arenibacter sp. GZD96]|uniref:SusC/RagA family TonB-linked outer membrane protein n=1 Tax=Aurantibrevibacter litoralis TaxID=3106030 RepID=UPI002AFEB9E7|nr:TonB-dependent receptor [Arenibacter sp. GZD-96]MEA1787093.1 TonB-dependent receptor [Arenibacter sp. GZD-96]